MKIEDIKELNENSKKLNNNSPYGWRLHIPTSDDLNDIQNLVEKYMKGSWERPASKNITEDVKNLIELTIGVSDELKKDIEYKYLAYLLVSAKRSKRFSRKWEIYKFLYFDKPIKQISERIAGRKFSLYDYIPSCEVRKLQELI